MADNKPRSPFAPPAPRKGSGAGIPGQPSGRPGAPRGGPETGDLGPGQDLAAFFADQGPMPAAPDEIIDSDAATRVADVSMFQQTLGEQPYYPPQQPASQPVQSWRSPAPDAQGATLTAGAFAQHMPLPEAESRTMMMPSGMDPSAYGVPQQPYYPPPQDPVYVASGHLVDPQNALAVQGGLPVAEAYGLVPAGQPQGQDPNAGYSWLRINPPEHVGQVSQDLVMMTHPDGFAASQYRALRYRLEQETNTQILVVTSARERDGKSVTAANLALALAEGGRIQVLLIDASLRNPAQHKLFGIRGDLGLTSVLAARQDDPNLPIDVIGITRSLCLIPAGPPVASAHAALSSEAAAVLMGIIRREFRYIIVDSASVYGTAETLAWHGLIDKYILVARAEKSTTEDLTGACDRLQRDRILGVTFVGGKGKRK